MTYKLEQDYALIDISTHTLTWSVTYTVEENRRKGNISTHTLTWSVTFTILYFLKWKKHFNSHAHVERDQLNSYLLCAKLNFNSHAHVERDTEGLSEIVR